MRFCPIPGYDTRLTKYVASDAGEIFSLTKKTGELRKLKQRTESSKGRASYRKVRMTHRWELVNRLVAAAFFGGPIPTHFQVRHINGNSLDNRKSNLRLGTHLQNYNDSTTRHRRFKLDPKLVREIRQRLMEGSSLPLLAVHYGAAFGICYDSIYKISIGETWRNPGAGFTAEFRGWMTTKRRALKRA